MLGRGRQAYFSGIHSALGRDYQPLARLFMLRMQTPMKVAVNQ